MINHYYISMSMGLEQRVHYTLKNGCDEIELNRLLQDLARYKETDALIRVWDIKGTKKITKNTWIAIEQLHNLGKGNIPSGTIVIPADRQRLPAARRLHKIIKGKIISARSDAAKKHLPAAIKYIDTKPDINGKHRSVQAKMIKTALSVDRETARGLVTKLKQKKLLH